MSHMLNETNIEITRVTIPETETISNINTFLRTMGRQLSQTDTNLRTVIKSLNESKIIIKGTRNEAFAIAEQLHWKMVRVNPKIKEKLYKKFLNWLINEIGR